MSIIPAKPEPAFDLVERPWQRKPMESQLRFEQAIAPVLPEPGRLFDDMRELDQAVRTLSYSDGADRGAIYTKPVVVDAMLDLCGYTTDRPLWQLRLLEPACGDGNFLLPALERLIKSWRESGEPLSVLRPCVRAVEIHRDTFNTLKRAVVDALVDHAIPRLEALVLARQWLSLGDFLLSEVIGEFDVVIGNPPYLRPEAVPDPLLKAYRERFATMSARADLYVPFFERGLSTLAPGGRLAFLCTDRWTKNQYGRDLRTLIAREFALTAQIDLNGLNPFQSDVTTYPAITVIDRPADDTHPPARIAAPADLTPNSLQALAREMTDPAPDGFTPPRSGEPWLTQADPRTGLVRRLEGRFPTLEATGCTVGIGVATGADHVFIGDYEALDVEPCRKLPLAKTRDIADGSVRWKGLGLINPFSDEGGLVDLDAYPRLRAYLEDHREALSKRHIAKKSPQRWYRTIDRIHPNLATREKLLIPDIKGDAHIVLESGRLYPHHNLYVVTSDAWDLAALRTVLATGIARLFVEAYCTKMRGGFLRFQAQYLRRIRLPLWETVPDALRQSLRDPATAADARDAVAALYGLSDEERMALFSETPA